MSKVATFLARQTGLTENDVRAIIARAPRSYKFYRIAKRTGGHRIIAHPAREVKALQRLLVKGLGRLPIHECATAYKPGTSIKENAARHAASGPIKKYDFQDFFPSIQARDWKYFCNKNSIFDSPEDINLTSLLLFHNPRKGSEALHLAIGAPSSPWLSNVIMYEFDDLISRSVEKDHIIYTRYADDLTFSAPRTGHLTRVDQALKNAIAQVEVPRLVLNQNKTVLATTKYRRVVTGLVLTQDGKVSIGRDRKRTIRAMLHHAALGRLSAPDLAKLKGLLAFADDIEPGSFKALIRRYGEAMPVLIREFYDEAEL